MSSAATAAALQTLLAALAGGPVAGPATLGLAPPTPNTLPPIASGLASGRGQVSSAATVTDPVAAAVGTVGQGAPTSAVQVSNFPQRIFAASAVNTTVGVGVIGQTGFSVPANGTVTVQGTITGAPAEFTISFDGGATFVNFNSGQAQVVNGLYGFSAYVFQGDQIDFSTSANTTVKNMRCLFAAGQV
jgi:hypothetical protein